MRVEIVAVGTELLLGQIADTNSAWLGDQLAAGRGDVAFPPGRGGQPRADHAGVSHGAGPQRRDHRLRRTGTDPGRHHPGGHRRDHGGRAGARPGDRGRHRRVLQGPGAAPCRPTTPARPTCRSAPPSSPSGLGTAPGLICPLGNKVIYAVPGVPYEMAEMFERGILPDLRARMAEAGEEGVIVSRVVRTWGASESGLAEALQGRIDVLDADEADGVPAGSVTLAFLASGIEGIKVRITARAPPRWPKERPCSTTRRRPSGRPSKAELGDIVFGVDDESMEVAVAAQLIARGLTLGRGGVAHRRAHRLAAGRTSPARRPGSAGAWWRITSR